MLLSHLARLLLVFSNSELSLISPTDACFASSYSLEGLVHCLEKFTVPSDYYDQLSYLEAQPNSLQRDAWFESITTLLSTHNNCTAEIIPPILQGVYAVNSFADKDGHSFCVLYERTVSPCTERYEKGWGIMVVPLSHDHVSRLLHLSAPHPFYDRGTSLQATHLFKTTNAKSLLIPGRMRPAYHFPSRCIVPTSPSTMYYMTDPAHNDLEPFFDANRAIWEWQERHGGCPSSSCAFIQFHGKAGTTCPDDDIFLSTGLANDSWYTDSTDRPIKRLKKQLQLAFKNYNTPITISLPSDSRCILTATKNVVGRYLNNLPTYPHTVCAQPSEVSSTEGVFVHIEQAAMSRGKGARKAWTAAIKSTFEELDSGFWETTTAVSLAQQQVDATSPTSQAVEEETFQILGPRSDDLDDRTDDPHGSVVHSFLSNWHSRYYLLFSFLNFL